MNPNISLYVQYTGLRLELTLASWSKQLVQWDKEDRLKEQASKE